MSAMHCQDCLYFTAGSLFIDLVANTSIARRGHSFMAVNASLGGSMVNIFLYANLGRPTYIL